MRYEWVFGARVRLGWNAALSIGPLGGVRHAAHSIAAEATDVFNRSVQKYVEIDPSAA